MVTLLTYKFQKLINLNIIFLDCVFFYSFILGLKSESHKHGEITHLSSLIFDYRDLMLVSSTFMF
jgi:hypothetical protein